MRPLARMLPFAALLLSAAPGLLSQPAADPSGHWEGTVQLPNMDLRIEVDLARNAKGEPAGTFSQPTQGVKGLPFSSVAMEGRTVRLVLRAGPQTSTFAGVLSADGKSITGDASQGGESAAFSLTRTGDARIAPAPRNAPIGKELEGTWNGTLDLGERQMRIILKLANQPDGTASGTIMSPDGSGVEIAIAMKQKGSHLAIDVASVGASYVGDLNAAGTELDGTWSQAQASLPLTFRRAAK